MIAVMETTGDDFKARIKSWLRSRGVDYLWLAEQCGVSENTVRNWMAKAPIPALKKKLLLKLITQLPGAQQIAPEAGFVDVEPTVSLSIRMSPEVYEKLVRVAYANGTEVAAMLNAKIMELASTAEPVSSSAPMLMRNRKVLLPVDEGERPRRA